jgi:hypothetical protein
MEIYTDALTIFFFAYCLLYNAFLFFYVIVRHQTSPGLDAFAGHWPAKMYGPRRSLARRSLVAYRDPDDPCAQRGQSLIQDRRKYL